MIEKHRSSHLLLLQGGGQTIGRVDDIFAWLVQRFICSHDPAQSGIATDASRNPPTCQVVAAGVYRWWMVVFIMLIYLASIFGWMDWVPWKKWLPFPSLDAEEI